LIELAAGASLDRMVTTVVRARRRLVHDQFSAPGKEHLHCVYTRFGEGIGHAYRELLRLCPQCRIDARRSAQVIDEMDGWIDATPLALGTWPTHRFGTT
jgi:hypothetical protein